MGRAWLLVLVGCGPSFVKLEPARVATLSIGVAAGDPRACLRPATQLQARVTYSDHTVLRTHSSRDPDGTLRPSELAWTTPVGTIDRDARLQLPDLLAWHDREVPIEVRVPGRTDLVQRMTLVPRFDCDDGSKRDGIRDRGFRRIDVSLTYVDTKLNGRLVLVRLAEAGQPTAYHLLDRRGPSAARFVVSARGAAGRDGNSGSSGTTGSSGSSGFDGSSGGTCQDGSNGSDGSGGGNGGDGGDGDDGGHGGHGGQIEIRYPAELPELAAVVEVDVAGGRGGQGGAGGSGGRGGDGGRGGRGGSGGSTTDSDGSSCFTSSGRDGHDGSDGRSGSSGSRGADGRAGRAGTVVVRPEATELFAAERLAGWRIAADPAGPSARR